MRTLCASSMAMAVLCACARVPASNVVPAIALSTNAPARHHDQTKFKTVFKFHGKAGWGPSAGLIVVNGLFYGTTSDGGAFGNGTVFSLTPSGKETVIHSFSSDGRFPDSPVLFHKGVLYGTTGNGPGSSGLGTVFALRTDGTELWTYDFSGGQDGVAPQGGLVAFNGEFYGTTYGGGNKDAGTAYAITTGGKEHVIYSFANSPDGASPFGNLIAIKDALYGTTAWGGQANRGTVFSVTTSGDENQIYAFKESGDGESPYAGLATLGGVMYGTTEEGGTTLDGTVFSVNAGGEEHILHTFGGSTTDGRYPEAPLLAYKGNLYGTTTFGGGPGNDGTVFEITPRGDERVLHTFSGSDGVSPAAGLVEFNGMLYGTTTGGSSGNGTVFSITP